MKLQNCYGNVSYISVPRWRPGLKMLRMKEVTALKDAAENLNTRKSTINWVRVFENWCDENGIEKNPETVRPDHEQLDKVLERFIACVCKQDGTDPDCKRNLSPMTKTREIIRILTKRAWNYFLISLVTIWLHILIRPRLLSVKSPIRYVLMSVVRYFGLLLIPYLHL